MAQICTLLLRCTVASWAAAEMSALCLWGEGSYLKHFTSARLRHVCCWRLLLSAHSGSVSGACSSKVLLWYCAFQVCRLLQALVNMDAKAKPSCLPISQYPSGVLQKSTSPSRQQLSLQTAVSPWAAADLPAHVTSVWSQSLQAMAVVDECRCEWSAS